MKKIIIGSMIVLTLIFTGCENKTQEEEKFSMTINSKNVTLGSQYDSKELGVANESFESENCALGNKNTVYIYDHFQVETYEQDTKSYIYSIYFIDENATTTEGIKIYDSLDDVIKTYGDKYKKDETCYIYTKGSTDLRFIIQNDIVISIEYKLNNI